MADFIAGYCGRCGAPFTRDAGPLCPRCGSPIVVAPPVAAGYTYPVLPYAMVPAVHRRLSRVRLMAVAGAALAIVVVLVSLLATAVRPTTSPCNLFCGPHIGTPLLTPSHYTNQKFGYTIDYDSTALTITNQDANGAEFDSANGDGSIVFTAAPGGDVGGANQNAVNALPSSTFQNLQAIGPVRGAEIGFVNGEGTAYSGELVPADGGSATPIGLIVMSAAHGGITITVQAFSSSSMDNQLEPYGLVMGEKFDYTVANTTWKGQP